MAIGKDEHDQGTVAGEADEFDVADRGGFVFRGEDEAGPACDTGERGTDTVERAGDVTVGRAEGLVETGAVFGGKIAEFEQPVDEETQAELGGDAACADMGTSKKSKIFKVLHDISDGRRTDLFCHAAGERARSDGASGFEITFDDAAEDFARAVVQFLDERRAVGQTLSPWVESEGLYGQSPGGVNLGGMGGARGWNRGGSGVSGGMGEREG